MPDQAGPGTQAGKAQQSSCGTNRGEGSGGELGMSFRQMTAALDSIARIEAGAHSLWIPLCNSGLVVFLIAYGREWGSQDPGIMDTLSGNSWSIEQLLRSRGGGGRLWGQGGEKRDSHSSLQTPCSDEAPLHTALPLRQSVALGTG